jgi:cytidylate kinase
MFACLLRSKSAHRKRDAAGIVPSFGPKLRALSMRILPRSAKTGIDVARFKRCKTILIIGSPGSGKTTLSYSLSRTLRLPVYHLDDYYWRSGWLRVRSDEFEEIQRQIVNRSEWIIDGLHLPSIATRLERADAVVWLLAPAWLCALRFIRRGILRNLGETESLPRAISTDARSRRPWNIDIRVWRTILFFRTIVKPCIEEVLVRAARPCQVVRLNGKVACCRFLQEIADYEEDSMRYTTIRSKLL